MNNDLNEFMKFFAETAPTIIKMILPVSMFLAVFTGIAKFLEIAEFTTKPKNKKEEKPEKPDLYEELKPYIDETSITATVDNLINDDRQDLLDYFYSHLFD